MPRLGMFKAHAGDELAAQNQFSPTRVSRRSSTTGSSAAAARRALISKELAKRHMLLGPFILSTDFQVKTFVFKDKDVRRCFWTR